MTTTDQWNPDQYEKFHAERMQPFHDLVALVRPLAAMRVVDLGCGTGEQAAMLAEGLPAATVEGVDSSPAMLEQAAERQSERVSFRLADIASITDFGGYDLVFSNAAMQWVPDNEAVMQRALSTMHPGAQIAVQVPKNEGHPSHRIADELATAAPFKQLLGGFVRRNESLSLERYATLMYENGFREQVCFEKIYGHELPSTDDVIEWVKGTSLGAYLNRLNDENQRRFLDAYRARLLAEVGDRAPYFYPFRRLLFWGVKSKEP
jgi:trans-aconitate 2-methyltransferase